MTTPDPAATGPGQERQTGAQAAPTAPAKGLAAALHPEKFSATDAMGGPRGLAEGVLPSFLFLAIYTTTGDLRKGLMVAIAVTVVALALRVLNRTTVMPGIAGLIGVLFSAFMANRSGEARDFFLTGLYINAAYGSVFAVSALPTPRIGPLPAGPWPVVGVALGFVTGEGTSWRANAARTKAFTLATWVFAAMFFVRLAVQWPLYMMNEVGMLGTARLVMSTPLFLICGWVTFLLLKRAPKVEPQQVDSVPSLDSDPAHEGKPGSDSR